MKKHFLLLLWMTLLPLAGWAYNYEVDVEVKPYNASVVWSGVKPNGVEASWIGAPGNSLTTSVKNAIAEQLEINDLADYNAGIHDYYLQLKSTADGFVESGDTRYNIRLNDANTAKLTITKYEGDVTFEAASLAFVNDELVYTSQPQALLSAGATATANGFTVPVVYATSETAENWVAWEALKETNANTGYTVYYKVVGTDNYAGSEVKTMSGTKAIAKASTATFNVSEVPGLVFDNTDQALLALTDDTKPIVPFGLEGLLYQIDGGEWTAFTTLDAITGKSAKNGAAYAVKFKIPETANWENIESAAINVTIAKATTTFTTEPTFADEFEYDGQAHQLITNPGVAEFGATPSFALRYKRPGANAFGGWITIHGSNWSENYELRTATNAGVYEIAYCTKTTADLIKADTKYKTITVLQKEIPTDSYTAPAANENLKANGDAQALITAGSWNVDPALGEFQYKVGEGAWGNTVPQETPAGTYTVYSKIVATSNYKDVDLGSVDVTIAAKDQVTIAIPAGQSFGYGTTPTLEYTADWGGNKGGDGLDETGLTWSWFSDAAGSNPTTPGAIGDYYVTVDGLAVTGPTSASKEIVYPAAPVLVKITAGQVNASISGEATYGSLPTFTLTHVSGLSESEAAGFDASHNLTTVTVKKDGAVLVNGEITNDDVKNALKALAATEYDLEATATLANYNVVVAAGKLNVSAKSIAGATITVITDANTIVYNNKAWGTAAGNEIEFTVEETSGIEAADYDVTYSNNVNAGTATITLTGKRNYTGNVTKDFTIKKADLTITADNFTGDKAWTYGKDERAYTVTVEGQAEGETALEVGGTLAGIEGTLKVKRTSNETVGMHTGALVAGFYDANDNKIDAPEATNYNLAFNPGNLQVVKGAVVIQLKEAVTATYGEDPATSINAAIKDIANYEYVSGLSELEAANFASFIDVAAATFVLTETKPQVGNPYTFTIAGATSTNYGVTINPGTYNVTAADITLYAKDQDINWATDPTATPNTTVSDATVAIVAGGLKYTDALTDVVASIDIASKNVGDNKISLTAAENANYNIFVNKDAVNNDKFGNLAVTGAAGITITRLDATENPTPGTTVADKLSEYNGVTANITLNATSSIEAFNTIKADRWYSLVLPFNTSVREVSERFGYAVVDIMDESSSKTTDIDFRLYLGDLEANKPFIFKVDKDIDLTSTPVTFTDKEIVYSAEPVASTADGKVKFIGVYDGKTGFSGHEYFFSLGSGNISGTKATSYVVPMGAYIHMEEQMDGMANSPEFHIEEPNGMTTSIKAIDFAKEGSAASSEGWYNLNGVQLESAPNQKGVYIQNGKKIVIK